MKANADGKEMSVIYLQMFGKFLERWPFLVPRGDQAETWVEVNAPETGSKGLSTCHFPTQDWKIFGERDDVTSIAGSPAPGCMPGAQSPLIILCRIRDQTTSLTPSRSYPCPRGLPPPKAVASIAWGHAPKSPGEVKLSADRWQRFRFLLLRAPPSLFLPTQEPSTETQLCRQTPQGLPKDILFLWENELIDFSALEEHEVQLLVQGVWAWVGAAEAPPLHLLGRGQQPAPQEAPPPSLLPGQAMPHSGVRVGFLSPSWAYVTCLLSEACAHWEGIQGPSSLA